HSWLTDWPPLASALLTAAERTRGLLVTMGNLYGYGPVTGPITEATPLAATHPKLRLRADMGRAALAAPAAGRIRATEVRASDYLAGLRPSPTSHVRTPLEQDLTQEVKFKKPSFLEANSIFSVAIGKPLLAGKRAWSYAPLDVPHSWT